MELRPEDLGMRRRVALILLRSGATSSQPVVGPEAASQAVAQAESFRGGYGSGTPTGGNPTAPPPSRQVSVGPYSRLLMSAAGLPASAAPAVVGAMSGVIGGIGGGIGGGFGGGFGIPALIMLAKGKWAVAIPFLILGLIGLVSGFLLPILMLRGWSHKAVTTAELKSLAEAQAGDALESSYLELGRELLLHPSSDALAEQQLKETYRALGEAIDRLPAPGSVVADLPALHEELAGVQAALEVETDPVIQESRERRAVTIEQTIRSAERAERNNRRVAALREELTTQVRALRLGFSDRSESCQDAATLDTLAASVRRIQSETDALSDARAELDAAVVARPSAPWHAVTVETEDTSPRQVIQTRQG